MENEHFFFRAVLRTRIRLAEAELAHDRIGAPGLLVHRFDRVGEADGLRPLAVEDACQVLGRWPGDKYVIPVEDALTGLARCCRALGAAALELHRLLIFAYLTGNGDLHAKNLAILRDQRGGWITPAFDLPSSAPYGDRAMALPVAGKIRQQLPWPMLRGVATAVGIPDRLATGVIREQVTATGVWIEDLDHLPVDANRIRDLRRPVCARIRGVTPAPDRLYPPRGPVGRDGEPLP